MGGLPDMPKLLLPLAILAGIAALAPSGAAAKPSLCFAGAIDQLLVADGKLDEATVKAHEDVDLIRCGDVTADGRSDAVFTINSGGTAGDIRFGVYRGGASPKLVLYKQAYKVGIARHDRRSFDVLQPHYGRNDPNCCPSSFRQTRYTWTGAHFKAGAAKKLKSAPRRFYTR
jgi:hypothetical protein